ncbi:MAG: L-aspartate oxidase [Deltaproteobacteria bacterium]|nr:L-aspartate oxidase [Candidatus Anaeroferrophillacea bacterium]
MIHDFDILVIGSGVAGLFFALRMAESGSVAVITKKEMQNTNTNLAQGGIAAVMDAADSCARHIRDTLQAGAGLCHRDVVEQVINDGPDLIGELVRLGVRFTPAGEDDGGDYDLTREGGHSRRRILHADDWTGREIEQVLAERCREHPRITIFENMAAIDLLTAAKYLDAPIQDDVCWGAYAYDCKSGVVHTFTARQTLLATGGAGKVYLFSTNPDIATGDGVAIAYRAGAAVANMEFFQFHPTCLYHHQVKNFLISEAVRGEGGILKRRNGQPFMEKYHQYKDLAPRDIVARAIDSEMKASGDDYVLLDITHLDADFIRRRFPHIHGTCLRLGIDITTAPIPVVPAAHYMCGGVVVDHDGRTTLPRLLACGESACTGLHGANRLASNSLLEAVAYAARAAAAAAAVLDGENGVPPEFPAWVYTHRSDQDENVIIAHNWDEIRRLMWSYVGIVRSHKRLLRARNRIELLRHEIREFYWDHVLSSDLLELRNIVEVAQLIITAAMYRRESRGLHYNIDFPARDDADWLVDTMLRQDQCFSRRLKPAERENG